MSTTKPGYELAYRLNPFIGTTAGIVVACSLLSRRARAYSSIQERWCSDEMNDAATAHLEAREARLEASITDLVERLPQPDDGSWRVSFEGDPRAHTVRLHAPDGSVIGCDS